MKRLILSFAAREEGNAVIDWIVLMSGVIMLSLSVVITITGGSDKVVDDTMEKIDNIEVGTG